MVYNASFVGNDLAPIAVDGTSKFLVILIGFGGLIVLFAIYFIFYIGLRKMYGRNK
jgi:hypothetical protein